MENCTQCQSGYYLDNNQCISYGKKLNGGSEVDIGVD